MVTGTIMFIYYMCVIKVDCKLSVIPKKRLIFFPVIAAVFIYCATFTTPPKNPLKINDLFYF